MTLLSISKDVYSRPVILFLISRGREDNITPNIIGNVHPPVILLLLSRVREDDIILSIAEGVHPPCDIVPNSQEGGERIILLLISQRVYIPLVI